MIFLRYLDVCLVLATAPFVLAAGMPTFGYAVGAAAWMITRAGGAVLNDRALHTADPRVRAGLQIAALMSRVWLIALAVILARYLGSRDDGVMAAVLVLAAFTVYFAISFVTRPGAGDQPRRSQGRPRTS